MHNLAGRSKYLLETADGLSPPLFSQMSKKEKERKKGLSFWLTFVHQSLSLDYFFHLPDNSILKNSLEKMKDFKCLGLKLHLIATVCMMASQTHYGQWRQGEEVISVLNGADAYRRLRQCSVPLINARHVCCC